MFNKILTTLGGIAFAGVLVAGGAYAFNADFRADVNYNVFGIERTVEDDTTGDDVLDDIPNPDAGEEVKEITFDFIPTRHYEGIFEGTVNNGLTWEDFTEGFNGFTFFVTENSTVNFTSGPETFPLFLLNEDGSLIPVYGTDKIIADATYMGIY